jgi:hypothetical protein
MCLRAQLGVILAMAAVSTVGLFGAEETRTWTAKNGHKFKAELLAADALRATLGVKGEPKWIVSIGDFTPPDAEAIRGWRATNEQAPLVDPRLLPAWPAEAAASAADTRLVGKEDGWVRYESANFDIRSDLELPVPVVRDLATVFESTRSALIAIPIGLHAGGEKGRYVVMMTASPAVYSELGGAGGSGGFYEARTRRTLVLLPNLGIQMQGGKLSLRHGEKLFVLKHEITHQLLAEWNARLPQWLHEGLPEFVASLAYSRGRYGLQNTMAGLRDYLLKWRKSPSDRSVRIIAPERLMAMQGSEWNEAVGAGAAYDLYNSAGLLTHYFMQQRNGAPVAGFLAALRRGETWERAEAEHLLPGRNRGSLGAELMALGRRIGVDVKIGE